ncbi:hypothetical protein MRB53_035585 [Persea americana]|uniref:Uncharacterized protein n=1 Tax=Persea americana TaxID=3435 RepID=A0ACC2K5P0_PERAE|nr:hypothetical protein MRB53_035585 [Persea americana]
MACLQRASPALREILLKLHRDERPMEIDHYLYEFGSVKYHVQASASNSQYIHLSVSTPLISTEVLHPHALPDSTLKAVQKVHSGIIEVVEPTKDGFQLTLRIDLSKFPKCKEACIKVITDIAALQAVILSSQLKDMLWNLGSRDISHGMYKPNKLIYHPREPFFIIRMPQKITAIFPMRFRDDSDVVLATAFFQELMDVGCSAAWAKAPPCTWSPIPPPELRGEPFEDLSTNGGFVSFDIFSRHVKSTRLDKTVWSLLNFYAYVKYHVKCTRGFIQRRMRMRLESLAEVMDKAKITRDEVITEVKGCRCVKKLLSFSKSKILRKKCGAFTKQIMRIHSPLKIQGFDRFHRKLLKIPKFTSLRKYTKVE